MHRMSGQDASFLYTETPTVLMHTLKIQIFDSPYDVGGDYEMIKSWLDSALDTVPMLRQRVMFVPLNLHHPMMVDDCDFDLDSHIYRAALPSPGGQAEFDQMISQIMCHRLDRTRPMWEIWAITGLEGDRLAIVHKIHHCMADGAATVRYLDKLFERHAIPGDALPPPVEWSPPPAPSGKRMIWLALLDHTRRDVRKFPAFLRTMWQATRRMMAFNREEGSPTMERLANPPPRTRLNHALSARRSFTTRQLPLAEVKQVAKVLGGTINDMLLTLSATALREYLLYHDELPAEPLCTSIPVSADEPGTTRDFGNRTTYLVTCLWTNVSDPLKRFRSIRDSTRQGKRELDVLGKSTFLDLMQFLPPVFSIWKTARKQRLRVADRADYRPLTNVIISNVPGPREEVSGRYGRLLDLYSMGPLVEGCGLNITAWSYAGRLNVSMMGCKNAVPDIDRLADAMVAALAEYHALADSLAENVGQKEPA